MSEPHDWYLFRAAPDEDKDGFFTGLSQNVSLLYRLVVSAGLRNPEMGFNPADYFGYFLPVNVDGNQLFAFGLIDIRNRTLLENAVGAGSSTAGLSWATLRDNSLRVVCYSIADFFEADFRFPMKLHQHRTWRGLSRWLSITSTVGSRDRLTRDIVRFLLTTPVATDASVKDATDNLFERLRKSTDLKD